MTLANWKAAPSRARGRLPTGPGLSNWARAQAASHVQVRAVCLLVTTLESWAIHDIREVDDRLHWVRDLLEGRVVAITEENR